MEQWNFKTLLPSNTAVHELVDVTNQALLPPFV